MNSADDHETRMKYHEPLPNTLSNKESFNSSVLTAISKEFSTDCILHEAIGLGNPNHVLIQSVKGKEFVAWETYFLQTGMVDPQ